MFDDCTRSLPPSTSAYKRVSAFLLVISLCLPVLAWSQNLRLTLATQQPRGTKV